jgi:rod shape-determining protein MreD
MSKTEKTSSLWLYLVLSALFVLGVFFNDFIDIAGIRPDFLLVFLVFLTLRERPLIAIIAAFGFGVLQDIVLPGTLQYWGMSPLIKTLTIFTLIKIGPLLLRARKVFFFLGLFGMIFVYYLFYNLLYYAGYVHWLSVIVHYTIPESGYTFLVLMLIHMIFPLREK